LVERLQLAWQDDNRPETNRILHKLLALRAPLGGKWQQLAQMAVEHGELTLAREAMDLFVDHAGDSPMARYQKAGLLAHAGAWQDADDLMRDLPPSFPDPAANAYSRGTSALYLGETDEARELLELATTLRPQSGSPWLSLATLVDFSEEPQLADRVIAAGDKMDQANASDRGIYHYALGKVHADQGEHAQAFTAFATGARQMKALVPYCRESDRISAREAVKGYTAETIAEIASSQDQPTDRSIFVTGLPRSGTTLVEQILTSHSTVSDGGEINRLGLLVKDIAGVSYEALSDHVGTDGASAIADLWHHWLDERFPGSDRIVDKTTNTSRMLGFAATLFPDAPLVWMKRDPLDCAWSCFRTCFMNQVPWSYDLSDIAFHFQLEDELLSQWAEILGDRLLILPYESLVSEPELWIPRLLAHCGLSAEPQVFTPHENQRPVTTSSVMQVRSPINRKGIGAAEPYRDFLEPFLSCYPGPD